MPPESKTSVRRLEAAERQVQALELRKAGVSFSRIAQQLGYKDGSTAYHAVERALLAIKQEPTDAVRQLSLERLDRMLVAVWQKAIGGDLLAVDRVLKIEERRAKLLGLDRLDEVDIMERVCVLADALGLDKVAVLAEAESIIAERRRGHATSAL